jgi:hypothetical protein
MSTDMNDKPVSLIRYCKLSNKLLDNCHRSVFVQHLLHEYHET